jgi:hypothetical protein
LPLSRAAAPPRPPGPRRGRIKVISNPPLRN